MDKRAQLILQRAQELFTCEHPNQSWPEANESSHTVVLTIQSHYLARAEDQLLAEGTIDCVDQS